MKITINKEAPLKSLLTLIKERETIFLTKVVKDKNCDEITLYEFLADERGIRLEWFSALGEDILDSKNEEKVDHYMLFGNNGYMDDIIESEDENFEVEEYLKGDCKVSDDSTKLILEFIGLENLEKGELDFTTFEINHTEAYYNSIIEFYEDSTRDVFYIV